MRMRNIWLSCAPSWKKEMSNTRPVNWARSIREAAEPFAYILANYGMEVIDSGVALHNMHAPWEVSSKADIYEAKKGYLAFLKYAD